MRGLLEGNELRSISFPSCTRFTECFERVATRARKREEGEPHFLLSPSSRTASELDHGNCTSYIDSQETAPISHKRQQGRGWLIPFLLNSPLSLPSSSPSGIRSIESSYSSCGRCMLFYGCLSGSGRKLGEKERSRLLGKRGILPSVGESTREWEEWEEFETRAGASRSICRSDCSTKLSQNNLCQFY